MPWGWPLWKNFTSLQLVVISSCNTKFSCLSATIAEITKKHWFYPHQPHFGTFDLMVVIRGKFWKIWGGRKLEDGTTTCLAICFSVVTPYANVTDRPTHLFPIARQASNRCLVSMHIRTTSLSNTEVIYYETCEYKIPVCPVSVYWAVVSQISSIQKSDGPVIPQTTTNVQCNNNNFTMNLMASIYQ